MQQSPSSETYDPSHLPALLAEEGLEPLHPNGAEAAASPNPATVTLQQLLDDLPGATDESKAMVLAMLGADEQDVEDGLTLVQLIERQQRQALLDAIQRGEEYLAALPETEAPLMEREFGAPAPQPVQGYYVAPTFNFVSDVNFGSVAPESPRMDARERAERQHIQHWQRRLGQEVLQGSSESMAAAIIATAASEYHVDNLKGILRKSAAFLSKDPHLLQNLDQLFPGAGRVLGALGSAAKLEHLQIDEEMLVYIFTGQVVDKETAHRLAGQKIQNLWNTLNGHSHTSKLDGSLFADDVLHTMAVGGLMGALHNVTSGIFALSRFQAAHDAQRDALVRTAAAVPDAAAILQGYYERHREMIQPNSQISGTLSPMTEAEEKALTVFSSAYARNGGGQTMLAWMNHISASLGLATLVVHPLLAVSIVSSVASAAVGKGAYGLNTDIPTIKEAESIHENMLWTSGAIASPSILAGILFPPALFVTLGGAAASATASKVIYESIKKWHAQMQDPTLRQEFALSIGMDFYHEQEIQEIYAAKKPIKASLSKQEKLIATWDSETIDRALIPAAKDALRRYVASSLATTASPEAKDPHFYFTPDDVETMVRFMAYYGQEEANPPNRAQETIAEIDTLYQTLEDLEIVQNERTLLEGALQAMKMRYAQQYRTPEAGQGTAPAR